MTRTAKPEGTSILNYVLVDFKEESGSRVFKFESVSSDYSRDGYRVKIDLALSRKYNIRLQDLPLLCRGVLERRDLTVEQDMYTYGEADMRLHADAAGASRDASAFRRRATSIPVRENAAAAGWNLPQA